MKTLAILLGLVVGTFSLKANAYVPNAKLAGESVSVRVLKDEARVTAVFEFEDLITRDAKKVYFPIFAADGADPGKILARAGFELEIRGKKLGTAFPCEAPEKFRKKTSDPRVYWFVADIDDLVEAAEIELHPRMIIRVSYSQPLIDGRFHYLPVIVGQDDRENRSWRYQMVVRSNLHIMEVVSKGTDYEQIAEGVVVYLKDGETVVVR
jgi:hypothetical protein